MFSKKQIEFLNTVIDDALKDCKSEEERNAFCKLNGSFNKQYDKGNLELDEFEQLSSCFNREIKREWKLEEDAENFNKSQKDFYTKIESLDLGDIEINNWSDLSPELKIVLDYRIYELNEIAKKRNQYYSHLLKR